MEEPAFFKFVPIILKIIRYRCGPFKDFWFYLKFSILTFFTLTTTVCIDNSERSREVFQELLVLFACHALDIFFMSRNVDKLVEIVTQPLIISGENAAHSKIAEVYKSRLDKFTKLCTALHIGGFYVWILGLSISIFLSDDDYKHPCIRITIGWIWRSRFDRYFRLLNLFWSYISIHTGLLFNVICVMAIVRIKSQVELLCSDLNSLNEILGKSYREKAGGGFANALQFLRVGFGADDVSNSRQEYKNTEKSEAEPISTENQKVNTEYHILRMNGIIEQSVSRCLNNLVEQHIRIIKLVALTDEVYRMLYLAVVQVVMIILALAIPKIGFDTNNAVRIEYVGRIIVIPGILISLSIFNYIGQQVVNESEKLREAVYGCDWTDKPRSLRRGILIMQIVASRPLRLTLGGIYTLSMETFINITKATYSYASLIQSIG